MANAQILNNELSSPESGLRVDSPYIYIPHPDKPKPVSGGGLFFGIPGTNPELPQNQKRVYYIQEDGSVLPIKQPVLLGAGGVPTYNGSPAKLAVDGSYSFKVIDKIGTAAQSTVYYSPKTSHPALQNMGETAIIEEVFTLSNGQTEVEFERVDISMATIDITGAGVDSRGLYRDVDYTIGDGASGIIFLTGSFPEGTRIRARQNAFTTQEGVALTLYPYAYDSIEDARTQDLVVGTKVVACGRFFFGDSLQYPMYVVVDGGTGTADNLNFISMDNGNLLQKLDQRINFRSYTEEVQAVGIDSGTLALNANRGKVKLVTLTQNISSIVFESILTDVATTLTVRFKQDGTGGRSVDFSGISSAGGNAPTITADPGAVDWVVFLTVDGTSWEVFSAGSDFKVIS